VDTPAYATFKYCVPQFKCRMVERPALEHRLGQALEQSRVVVVQAPAGFGKSATLARQVSLLPADCAVAWISADDDDNLPRFIAGLVTALEPYDVPWRVSPQGLVEIAQQSAAGLGACAAALCNALGASERRRGVLAIDDAHAIPDPRVFQLLDAILQDMPEGWTLLLGCRGELPLPLARLRMAGLVAEFGPADLAFSEREISALVDAEPGSPGPARQETVDALMSETGGWIAGVVLMRSRHKSAGPKAPASGRQSRRWLFEYLEQEVFKDLSPELREFLVRCSVLPTLTPSRCAVVAQTPMAFKLLDKVTRWEAFVSLVEGDELSLRLHELFRDCLLELLQRDHADEVPALLERAAATEPDPLRRVEMFIRAGAVDAAQRALADAAPRLILSEHPSAIKRATELFPEHVGATSGWVNYWRGISEWFAFDATMGLDSMHRAAEAFDRQGLEIDAARARAYESVAGVLQGRFEASRALVSQVLAQSTDVEALAIAHVALAWLESFTAPPEQAQVAQILSRLKEALVRCQDPGVWFRCVSLLNGFVGRAGTRELLQQIVDYALAIATDAYPALQGVASTLNAGLKLHAGQLALAGAELRTARETVQWLGNPTLLNGPLQRYTAMHGVLCGDPDETSRACEVMLDHARPWRGKAYIGLAACSVAACTLFYASVGEWGRALAMRPELKPVGAEAQPPISARVARFQSLALGRLEIHEGAAEQALAHMQPTMAAWQRWDSWGLSTAAHLVFALAAWRSGLPERAWQAISAAIQLAPDAQEAGSALMAGRDVVRELAMAGWGALGTPEERAVLRAWGRAAGSDPQARTLVQEPTAAASAVPAAPVAADGRAPYIVLSQREQQVLEQIARGDSNKVIARKLDLSPHTVKRHVARILDRICVSSRGEAAAWYSSRQQAGLSSDRQTG
jgi:LuxR family maltose regulon positive regulatory protein